MLNVKRIDCEFYNTSVYVLSTNLDDKVVLVDCGSAEEILKEISASQKVVGVLLTHVHCDHIFGLNRLLEVFPDLVVYTNEYGTKSLRDVRMNMSLYNDLPFVYEGNNVVALEDEITLLGDTIKVIPTPGHDPSCLSYQVGNNLYTGDSYIPGVRVVTTFPRSNKQQVQESLDKLIEIEKQGYRVLAGHHSSQ